jgi:hypothetical protein
MKQYKSIAIITAISLLITLAILLDVTPYLRGGFGWRWPYSLLPISQLFPLCLGVTIYLLGAWWLIRHTQRSLPLLIWSALGAAIIPILALAAREGDPTYALFARTTALLGTGQHWMATHVDWSGGEWRQWTAVMERIGGHMSNVPPGAPLIYHLIENVLPAQLSISLQHLFLPYQCHNFDLLSYTPGQWGSALFGMLMPLWAAMTVFPLFVATRKLTTVDARMAAVWWALVPAAASFTPSWSTLYPLLSVSSFLLLLMGIERERRYIWLVASGLVTGIGIFINFALLPLPLLFGCYTLLYYRDKDIKFPLMAGIFYGLGLIIPWILFWAIGGQTFFDLLQTSMQFHLSLDRPYWFWVWMHLWDWIMWTGFGLALLWLRHIWLWWREGRTGRFPLLGLVLLISMVILTISGTARGETGRVWLLFSPFLLIPALDGLSRFNNSPVHNWLVISIAQGLLMVVIVACLDVVGTNFTVPPSPPQVAVSHDVDATFSTSTLGNAFRLVGWEAQYEDGKVHLRLRWEGLSQVTIPYWFTAILVEPDGQTMSFDPWQPGGETRYPTTCWLPGRFIGDEISFPLPDIAPKGNWWISLAVYGDTGSSDGRLTVTQPEQPADSQIGLGPVMVQ